ncbi:MAG: transcription elongation factor subunit Spt4 [Candidatus Woesearchaeota archaeon]
MKKKVCKKCKIFVDGETCPLCKKNQFSTNWQGRIYFFDSSKSTIAKNMGVETKGEYAIKVR